MARTRPNLVRTSTESWSISSRVRADLDRICLSIGKLCGERTQICLPRAAEGVLPPLMSEDAGRTTPVHPRRGDVGDATDRCDDPSTWSGAMSAGCSSYSQMLRQFEGRAGPKLARPRRVGGPLSRRRSVPDVRGLEIACALGSTGGGPGTARSHFGAMMPPVTSRWIVERGPLLWNGSVLSTENSFRAAPAIFRDASCRRCQRASR